MKTEFTAKAGTQTRNNQTQIVATLGPATNTYEKIKALYEGGVDTFRLNFSHGTHEDHAKLFKIIEDLVLWENITNEVALKPAREAIRQSWRELV